MKLGGNPFLKWEHRVGYPDLPVLGVDEVGRGCLAGPVVAAAVLLPDRVDLRSEKWLSEVNDSKLLAIEERERLAPLIENWVAASAVCSASVEEIEKINIYHASHLAMERAVKQVIKDSGVDPEVAHVLVDGKFAPKHLVCASTPIVKGDQKSLAIACSSILAKVWRDRKMIEFDGKYPGFGFAKNKGYPTAFHLASLKEKGVTPIHRRSFGPVAEHLS